MLLWACLAWVFASTIVALLPMRGQYLPGLVLLLVAPLLIIWIARDVAWWAAALALLAFLSMFRNPLRYMRDRLLGRQPDLPK